MAVKLADKRPGLDRYLRNIVKARCGAENVYYQPPANLRMKYPCITYELDKIRNRNADNSVYRQTVYYTVTVIDTKPDSEMTAAMSLLEKASHDRHFISDNLYHDVFSVWY
nr:MAG TPA: tail completion protein [Caudoviricetes sp.]